MTAWLDAIMLASAAAGFVVCAGGVVPRGRQRIVGRAGTTPHSGSSDGTGTPPVAVIGMAGMLAAMADMTFDGVHVLPDVVWALLMLLGGPLLLAGGLGASRPSHCGFGMHRSLSMIAMAALMVAGGHGTGGGRVAVHPHGSSGAVPILAVLLVVGVSALLAYTVALVVAQRRVPAGDAFGGGRLLAVRRPVVEACLAAVSVTAMAGAMIL